MRLRPRFLSRIAVVAAIAGLVLAAPLHAQEAPSGDDAGSPASEPEPDPERGIFTGADIDGAVGPVFDAIVLRPLGLAGLAAGAVLFVPAAAFSFADEDAFDECVDLFLKIPARNVFTRRLGDF